MTTQDIATLGLRVDARQVQDGDRALQNFERTGQRAEQQTDRTSAAMARMQRMAAAVAAALSVGELVKYADTWANIQGQLKLVTKSSQELASANASLFALAQRTRSELSATVGLYANLTRSTAELNTTSEQRVRVTETINKAMAISGTSAEAAEGAIRQLGQAFGSGTLRGDEFNSVLEASPRLIQAIAEGMGKTTGDMRAMAEAGKLSSQAILQALLTQGQAIDDEFGKMPTTIGQAMTVLENSLLRTVGVFDQSNKISSTFAGNIVTLAEHMDQLAQFAGMLTVIGVAKWLSGAAVAASEKAAATVIAVQAERASIAAAIQAAEVAVAQAQADHIAALGATERAAALARLTLAQEALAGASAAGAAATGLGGMAMAALGGPVGLVTLALGLGAAAWVAYGNSAKDAQDKAKGATEKSTQEIIDDLDKQNNKLIERINLAKKAGMKQTAQQGGPAAEELARLNKEITALQDQVKAGTAPADALDRLKAFTYQYDKLKAAMDRVKGSQDKLNAASASEKFDAWMQKQTQYMTVPQKIAAAIADAKKELGDEAYAANQGKIESMIKASFAKGDVDKAKSAYQDLVSSIRTKIDEQRIEIAVGRNATDAQKAQIKFDEDLRAGKLKLSPVQKARVQELMNESAALEKVSKAAEVQRDLDKSAAASKIDRAEMAAGLENEYKHYGQVTEARELDAIAIKNNFDMERKILAIRQDGGQVTAQVIAQLESERDARTQVEQATKAQSMALGYAAQLRDQNRQFAIDQISDDRARADAQLAYDADLWRQRIKLAGDGTQAQKELQGEFDQWYANRQQTVAVNVDVTRAKELLDIMSALDDQAKSAAQGMQDAFGGVGAAIGGMTTALTEFQKTQAAVAAQLAAAIAASKGDPGKIEKARQSAALQSAQAQVKSYGDMAKAAKGFFKEGTTGYRAMEGAEKAFRAFEMALSIKTTLEKLGLLTTYTTAHAAATTAQTVATQASVAPDVAASMEKGQAAAAGVAAQASGDPYTAWIRMAAMAAAMAALGFAVSGGGSSVSVSEQRQKTQGTGTVLGDGNAKSQSIARAIEMTASNSGTQINYLSGMLMSLRAIESNISRFASQVVQSTDIANPKVNLNTSSGLASTATTAGFATGGALLGMTGAAWTAAAGSGIAASALASLGAAAGPLGAIAGAIVGGIISKIPVIGNALGGIVGGKQSLEDSGFTMDKASLAAILSSGARTSTYAQVKTDGGWFRSDKTSTKTTPLDQSANAQFSLVIESLADSITGAGKLLGVSGAGFEAQLNSFVIDIGKVSLKGKTGDEIQKELEAVFSKLGDDMAKYAVGGLQQYQKVGEGYLETLVRVATDYAKVDASMQSIGKTFGSIGIQSIAARENLISMVGGIDELQTQVAGFADDFLTEAQRLAPVKKYVTEQLAAIGMSWVDSREKFAQAVTAADLNTDAGQKTFATLMGLREAFAAVYPAIEDVSKSVQDIADERKDLMSQLDDLVLTSAQKLAKQRAALDASNQALFDQVQAAQAARDAQDEARQSLQGLADDYRNLTSSLEAFGLSLVTGDLSTLNTGQQEAALRKQYEEITAKAQSGDMDAIKGWQDVAQKFLAISQKANGGDERYMSDYANVLAMTDKLAQYTDDRADLAMQQLDAAERQIASIESLNAIMRASQTTLETIAAQGMQPSTSQQDSEYMARVLDELRKEVLAQTISTNNATTEAAAAGAEVQRRATMSAAGLIVGTLNALRTARTASNTAATLDN